MHASFASLFCSHSLTLCVWLLGGVIVMGFTSRCRVLSFYYCNAAAMSAVILDTCGTGLLCMVPVPVYLFIFGCFSSDFLRKQRFYPFNASLFQISSILCSELEILELCIVTLDPSESRHSSSSTSGNVRFTFQVK